jgi:hypothetical protein
MVKKGVLRRRRVIALIITGVVGLGALIWQADFATDSSLVSSDSSQSVKIAESNNADQPLAIDTLSQLAVKGKAPKTGYARNQFGNGWANWRDSCNTREKILNRDLTDKKLDKNGCTVLSGQLLDPYTGQNIAFTRGAATSSAVQIDHVVALSNAWQTGAQNLSADKRKALANDDLELLAVDGPANQQKSDGDAATWLPSNKSFRCQYVARQIAVKQKYELWVTSAEKTAMQNVLKSCPEERLPAP